MRLFVGASILKREFGREIPAQDQIILQRATRSELLLEIKDSALPAKTKLLKGYATSVQGARRLVYLLLVEAGDLFLLFYRPKGDPIGDNVSIKNPAFKSALEKHLSVLKSDIARDQIREIPLKED